MGGYDRDASLVFDAKLLTPYDSIGMMADEYMLT